MRILRKEIAKPTVPVVKSLEEFADEHDLILQIEERGQNGVVSSYMAWFVNVEERRGMSIIFTQGTGWTEQEAINNYAKLISGKTLVVNANNENRKEIVAPKLVVRRWEGEPSNV